MSDELWDANGSQKTVGPSASYFPCNLFSLQGKQLAGTYSSSYSAVEKNKSYCNHVMILCYSPSKQNTHTQKKRTKHQQPRTSNENALISPAHARAGLNTDRALLSWDIVLWWGKTCTGRFSKSSSCFHIANPSPEPKESARQQDINLHPDMLRSSKRLGGQWKPPEGKVAQGWLGGIKTWKSKGSLTTEQLLPWGTRGETKKAWELQIKGVR